MFASHWPRDASCLASFRHYIPLPIVDYLESRQIAGMRLVIVREHLSKGNIRKYPPVPSFGNIWIYPCITFFREYMDISTYHFLSEM